MQSLNISSLRDDKLQDVAYKIALRKHVSIFSINNTLTKCRTYPHNFWSSMKVKIFFTIDTLVSAVSVTGLSIGL